MRPALGRRLAAPLVLAALGGVLAWGAGFVFLSRAAHEGRRTEALLRLELAAQALLRTGEALERGHLEAAGPLRDGVAEVDHELAQLTREGLPAELGASLGALEGRWGAVRALYLAAADRAGSAGAPFARLRAEGPALVRAVEALDQAHEAESGRLRQWVGAVLTLCLVLGAGLLSLAVVRLRREVLVPVRALDAAARRVQAGDWSARAPPGTSRELGTLAETFNRLVEESAGRMARAEHERAAARAGLEAVLTEAPLGLLAADAEGRVRLVEGSGARVLGLGAGAVRGRSLCEPWEGMPWRVEDVRRALAGEEFSAEAPAAGRWWNVRFRPRPEAQGVLLVVTDVTARREAEARAHADDQRRRLVLEQLPATVWTCDEALAVTSVEGVGLRELALRPEDLLGRSVADVLEPHAPTRGLAQAHREALAGARKELEYAWRGRLFRAVLEPFRDASGRPGVLGLSHDVTVQRRAEEALRESRAELSRLLEHTEDAIWSVDRDLTLQVANRAFVENFRRAFGVTLRTGLPMVEVLRERWPELARKWEALYRRALAGERLHDTQRYWLEGEEHHYIVSLYPIGPPGEAGGVSCFTKDVTASQRALSELQRSEERFEQVFHASPLPILLTTLDEGRVVDVNEAFEEVSGYGRGELVGRALDDIRMWVQPGQRREVVQALRRAGRLRQVELQLRAKGGAIKTVLASFVVTTLEGTPCLVALAEDLTEHKRLEAQLRQSAKMEAIGQLAGGVAHDFNNLLTVILGNTELLERRLEGHPSRAMVDQVHKAAARAATLTRQLLAFGRKQTLRPVVLDPNRVVKDLSQMLRRLIHEDIELVTELSPEAGQTRVDAVQLEQVLINLAVNARDAMPEGGRLTLRTRASRVAPGSDGAEPTGDWVVLEVEDTGIGMGPEVQSHIFEPFFTTKEQGKGTGLGLATVYGIVHQSGGRVRVESAPGRGSRFTVYLPRHAAAAERAPVPAPAAPRRAKAQALRGTTVLVAEDEDDVRELVRGVLESEGYRVLAARDGVEAEALAHRHAGPIDLLVTDMVMPRLRGSELARRLASARPGLRVLYVSGYPGGDPSRPHSVASFLPKPFTPEVLLSEVERALRGEAPREAPAVLH